MKPTVYDFTAKTIGGKNVKLSEFKGKVLLIVNVASHCGFTPQYTGLEDLYRKYQSRGLEILGFPCNQFGGQEPGSEDEIKSYCETNFGVSFPLFAKIEVNGPNADPLYEYLKSEKKGLLGTKAVKWNFTKFLVDRQGLVVKRYSPRAKPEDLEENIVTLL
ncbi:MAG: glutathione peroxidase [Pseudobdellovibrionaceae bacterium]